MVHAMRGGFGPIVQVEWRSVSVTCLCARITRAAPPGNAEAKHRGYPVVFPGAGHGDPRGVMRDGGTPGAPRAQQC